MTFVLLFLFSNSILAQQTGFMPLKSIPPKYKVDKRVDNMGYWKRMAELGLVPVAPVRAVPKAVYKSSKITDASVATPDSPDILITSENATQSENSVFISPNDRFTVLNSNNSSPNPYPGYFLGADDFFSTDGGQNWDGQINGAGSNNMGDPSTAINYNGRWFVGYIHSGGGQALSYSDNGGLTWKVRAIASPPTGMGGMLDKSHLWIDNSPASPFKGTLYDGWTVITGPSDGQIQISRSTDNGLGWQIPAKISDSVHAGSLNQGVNIATGPNGEAYAVWSVYDNFPADESALGFARSINGGQKWEPARRIIDNIRGIRVHGVNKLMRTNSFPSMAVDLSNSPWRGTLYVVWANVNTPGINTGSGVDIFMIRSSDGGFNWSVPLRINQDLPVPGKQHFFPWICCDPANGNLSVIFYDDRDTPPGQAETWVATSMDGGNNWQDFRVSDVAFTPSPVTGLSDNYFGDYLGIAANSGMVYPCWTDNRLGIAESFVSPFRLGPVPGQPYIAYQASHYNDTLTGNGNGRPDFGETALLGLTLRNLGDQPDSNVRVTLSSDSPYISFTDSTENFGNFAAIQSKALQDVFSVHISDTIPNGTRIPFTLTATDNRDSSYLSNFTLPVSAPEVMIAGLSVNDSATNNSHALDAGETAFLVVKITNNSLFDATSLVCKLESPQSFIHLTQNAVNMGNLASGQSGEAVFQVKVNDSIMAGTLAGFKVTTTYSGRRLTRMFNEKIGLILEDWESGNLRKFSWFASGDKAWGIDSTHQYAGKYCLRSGVIYDNQTSSLFITYRALTSDSISFYRKISSEAGYDKLNFYIDNSLVGQWSGDLDWEREVFPVVGGNHRFKWEYSKDQAVTDGLDAAFIDNIEFPSLQYTTADAGKDLSIYACQNFSCNGVATFYDSLRWTSLGTGHFENPRLAVTKYFISDADKAAGSVTLVLTVYGPSAGEIAVDSVTVTILPVPTSFAGNDAAVCAGIPFRVSNSSATNYKSLHWVTDGNGKFDDPTLLMPLYTPDSNDYKRGKVKLVLVTFAGNSDACGYAIDSMTLTIYPLPKINLPGGYFGCTGYSLSVDATTEGAVSYEWLPGGMSTPVISVDTARIGANAASFSVTVTDGHGCQSTSPTKVAFVDCPEKQQTGNIFFRIYPNPCLGEFMIEFFAATTEKVSLKLVNTSGMTVLETNGFDVNGMSTQRIDLGKIAQGPYFITVNNSGNSNTQKLIIL